MLAGYDGIFEDESSVNDEQNNDMDDSNDTSTPFIILNANHKRDISSISTTPITILEDDTNEKIFEIGCIDPSKSINFLKMEREKALESEKMQIARKPLL